MLQALLCTSSCWSNHVQKQQESPKAGQNLQTSADTRTLQVGLGHVSGSSSHQSSHFSVIQPDVWHSDGIPLLLLDRSYSQTGLQNVLGLSVEPPEEKVQKVLIPGDLVGFSVVHSSSSGVGFRRVLRNKITSDKNQPPVDINGTAAAAPTHFSSHINHFSWKSVRVPSILRNGQMNCFLLGLKWDEAWRFSDRRISIPSSAGFSAASSLNLCL